MADNKGGADRPTEMVTFRMNKAELQQLTQVARELGMDRSALIRQSIRPVIGKTVGQQQSQQQGGESNEP